MTSLINVNCEHGEISLCGFSVTVLLQSRVAKRTVHSTICSAVPYWLGAPHADLHGSTSGARPVSAGGVGGQRGRTSAQTRHKKTVHRGVVM